MATSQDRAQIYRTGTVYAPHGSQPLLILEGSSCPSSSSRRQRRFVVNTQKLKHKDDVKSDDMGVWVNNRVDVTDFQYDESRRKVTRNKGGYTLKRVYYKHGHEPNLRKIVSSVKGTCN